MSRKKNGGKARNKGLFPTRRIELNPEPNSFAWGAVALIWVCVICGAVVLAKEGIDGFPLAIALDWSAMALGLSAALWIGAGVVYAEPDIQQLKDTERFKSHTVSMFLHASRHCKIGTALLLCSYIVQVASKAPWIHRLG